MKPAKLTRRERALVQHAVRRAIQQHEDLTEITLYDSSGRVLRRMTLAALRNHNRLYVGDDALGIYTGVLP